MENNYLARFDEKQRRDIEFYVEKMLEQHGNDCFTIKHFQQEIRHIFKTFQERYANQPETELKRIFPSITTDIGSKLYEYIFYKRIIDGDLAAFCNGLYTAQRIHFLGDRYGSMGHWGNDTSYIMIRLRNELAVYDNELLHAYLSCVPGPFGTGYPFYVSFANGLYLILQSKLGEASDYLKSRLGVTSYTSYEHAVLVALKAIADKNEAQFLSGIDDALRLYVRQQNIGLMRYLSLEALGLYNVATVVWGKIPKEPQSIYWDGDFFHYLQKGENTPHFLTDVPATSPLFERWIKELPPDVTIGDLILDLRNAI